MGGSKKHLPAVPLVPSVHASKCTVPSSPPTRATENMQHQLHWQCDRIQNCPILHLCCHQLYDHRPSSCAPAPAQPMIMPPSIVLPVMLPLKMVQPGAASDGAAFNGTTCDGNNHHGAAYHATMYNGTAYDSANASGTAFDCASKDSAANAPPPASAAVAPATANTPP